MGRYHSGDSVWWYSTVDLKTGRLSGCASSDHMSLKKQRAASGWLVATLDVREIPRVRRIQCAVAALNVGEAMWKEMQMQRVDLSSQPARKWRSQSYNHKKMIPANNLNGFEADTPQVREARPIPWFGAYKLWVYHLALYHTPPQLPTYSSGSKYMSLVFSLSIYSNLLCRKRKWIHLRLLLKWSFWFSGSERGLRFCISDELPGDADATGLEIKVWVARL